MRYFFTLILLTSLLGPAKLLASSETNQQRTALDQHIMTHPTALQQTMYHLLKRQSTTKKNIHDNIITTYKVDKLIDHLTTTYMTENTNLPDSSIIKYVSPTQAYTNPLYKPHDLLPLQASQVLSLDPDLPSSQYQLRSIIHAPLEQLATAYYQHFQQPLHLNSARRSYHEQQNRFAHSCYAAGICALPGTSEHQNGLTIDIAGMWGTQYERMRHHAHLYGFHQSYQKGKEIDGFQVEPWHWRYLGPSLAGQLYDEGITFGEWWEMYEK